MSKAISIIHNMEPKGCDIGKSVVCSLRRTSDLIVTVLLEYLCSGVCFIRVNQLRRLAH